MSNGTSQGQPERRSRPPSPHDLDTARRWPKAKFSDVEDEALREACFVVQDFARAVRLGMDENNWSAREMAERAGVNREQVHNLVDGKSWPAIYTVIRLLHALDREIVVPDPPNPRDA